MPRRLTEPEIDAAIRAARATLGMEGLTLTEEEEALIRSRLRREITRAEFLRLAKELAARV